MANMKLNYVLVCDYIVVDKTNKVSLINIFNIIHASNFPAVHPRFYIATNTIGEISTHTQKIEVVNLRNDKIIAKVENNFEIKEGGGNNFIGNFFNAVFDNEGKYWIKITIDENVYTNKDEHFILLRKRDTTEPALIAQ